MPARIPRRRVLTGLLVSPVVVACTRRSSGRPDAHIVVANYPLYIDATTNQKFTEVTGITVEYHESADPPSIAGADVVIAQGQSGEHSALWAMNMVGVAHTKDVRITQLADLFRPALTGKVAMPLDMQRAMGVALLADHVDVSTVTLDQATVTAERLANSVRIGQVALVARPLDRLLAGEAQAAVVVAADTVAGDVQFTIPEEGGLLFRDMATVVSKEVDISSSKSYVDFIRDPLNAAERFRVLPVMWEPNERLEAALRRDAPDVLDDPRRNPSPDVRARLHEFRKLSTHEQQQFDALFESVIRAAG